ncbi:MAG: hypothetical protein JO362_21130 [Streptomycetaceae bacterium]|nr:hypothetical protein [Streptomycetaceae bacterium]
MTRHSSSSRRHGHASAWPASRRIAVAALVLAVLLAVAGFAAWITARDQQHEAARTPPVPAPSVPSSVPVPSPGTGSVARPPRTSDPVVYAKAAAAMLWSYDTRTTSRDQQLAGMHAWMTAETAYSDWSSIAAQVPDAVLWSRMQDQSQYASATVTEGHFPSAFRQALAEDPAALSEAYIYAVTVTGRQLIAWKGGGAGAEATAVTLAVQCRPSRDCALVSLAPSVAP